VRLLGYGAIMLTSLLKFYPFVLFLMLLRERFRVFLLLAVIAACGLGGFIWAYWHEIARMAVNIPQPSYFADAFGASQLPAGIGLMLAYVLERAGAGGTLVEGLPGNLLLLLYTYCLLATGTLMTTLRFVRCSDFQAVLRGLTQRESLCLVAGAALIDGCFFSGRSIGYREVLMLLAFPGLLALTRTSPSDALSRVFRITVWVGVTLMMYPVPQRLIDDRFGSIVFGSGSLAAFTFWFCREVCWWWFVAVLAAILIRFALDSPVWQAVAGRGSLRRRPDALP
jgi:hypothetical protein